MKRLTHDPLTMVLLIIGLVFVISSGLLSSAAFTSINVERIQLHNKGVPLSALLLYPEDPTNLQRPAILAYHGWGGTKESILTNCLSFANAGFVVLIPDLRGHGESGGVSTLGLVEQSDSKVSVDYLISRSDLVNASALAVWGASFGGMISLLAAGNDPRLKAAIAVSAPSNTTAWLEERDFRTNERISYRPYMLVDPSNQTAVEERSPINSVNNIKNLLVMHGELDPLVPVHHAKDLIKASNNSDHRLIVFSGEEHNINGDRVKKETTQFLKNVFGNPYTSISTTPAMSYYYLMSSWLVILIGGLAITMGILSFLPIVQKQIKTRWSVKETTSESSFEHSLLTSLVLLLVIFVFLHISSVIVSLEIMTFYSTLLSLTLTTLGTVGLLAIGHVIIQKNQLSYPSNEHLKKWILEIGIALGMILGLYIGCVFVADQPWIPFVNLEGAFRISGILITIGIVLSVEALFYWGLIHRLVTEIDKNLKTRAYILRMSVIYLITKCTIFFSLLLFWHLLEFRLIILGIVLFGLLGIISAFIRYRWGFLPTTIFTILAGLTAYSAFSVFFFLL